MVLEVNGADGGFLVNLPYRKLTEQERSELLEIVNGTPSKQHIERIWKSTVPEARRVMSIITSSGYTIEPSFEWTSEDPEHCGEMAKIYTPIAVQKRYELASIALWKSKEFNENPIKIELGYNLGKEDLAQIEWALNLRKTLIKNDIPFELHPSREKLAREISCTESVLASELYTRDKLLEI